MNSQARSVPSYRLPSRDASQRGFVIILLAIGALLLIGFIGLAVDTAHVNTTAQQLQSAADASALAAARNLKSEVNGNPGNPFVNTRAAAVNIAAANAAATASVKVTANTGNAANGDCVIGIWDSSTKSFTPDLATPNAVKVTARRTAASTGGSLDLFFGAAFGNGSSDVSRAAIARYKHSPNPAVLVLDPTAQNSLKITGNGSLDAAPNDIQVNSSSSKAISVSGSGVLSGGTISTVGNIQYKPGSITGTVITQAPVVADPLADVLPDTASWNTFKSGMAKPLGAAGKITTTGTYNPGYYPLGLDTNSGAVVTLNPGSYMFGGGVNLNGGSTLNGTGGVTLFLDLGANLGLTGGGGIKVTAPSSGTYQGLALFSHRGNTSNSAVSLGGNGVVDIQGTVYVPGGTVAMGGTSAQEVGELICNKLDFSGNGKITGKNVVPPEGPVGVCLVQ